MHAKIDEKYNEQFTKIQIYFKSSVLCELLTALVLYLYQQRALSQHIVKLVQFKVLSAKTED